MATPEKPKEIASATARLGRMVFPPGPVYPPTRPSMLRVGCDTRRTSESCHDSFSIHRSTPNAFFVAASFFFGMASSRMRRCVAVSGRTLSKKPSTAGV